MCSNALCIDLLEPFLEADELKDMLDKIVDGIMGVQCGNKQLGDSGLELLGVWAAVRFETALHAAHANAKLDLLQQCC